MMWLGQDQPIDVIFCSTIRSNLMLFDLTFLLIDSRLELFAFLLFFVLSADKLCLGLYEDVIYTLSFWQYGSIVLSTALAFQVWH